MPQKIRDELLSFIKEYHHRWELKDAGITNRNRILLVGPPGCGKSATAKSLGRELNLPVFVLRFDSLIGSYLGQTSQNLSSIFEFIHRTPSVVLIDEIDAISSIRGGVRDVAELDRVVISLMQQLELISPAGFLICTSNIPKSIDTAVLRRFDSLIEFPRPTPRQLKIFYMKLAKRHKLQASSISLKKIKSFAEVERLVINEVRKKILAGSKKAMNA